MIGEDPFIYSCEYLTFSVCWDLYTVVSISRSQCAGQKNIAKSGAGTQNRIEVAGKKNAALFEWAAFVKAEK